MIYFYRFLCYFPFPALMKESSGGKNAAVLYQLILRLCMGTFFSNHTFLPVQSCILPL